MNSKVVFILFFILNCNVEERKEIIEKKLHTSGETHYVIYKFLDQDTIYNYDEFYINGSIHKKGQIKKNGKRVGKWYYYDEFGTISFSGSYKNGAKIGTWNYKDGSINWGIFIEKNNLYQINYPSSWTKIDLVNTEIITFYKEVNKNTFSDNFSIQIFDHETNLNIIKDESLSTIKNLFGNYKLLNTYNVLINGKESLILDFQVKDGDNLISVKHGLIQGKGKTSSIMVFSDSNEERFKNEIIFSFQFLE